MKEKNSLVLKFCWPFRSTSHILLLPQKVHYLLLDTLITLLDLFSKKHGIIGDSTWYRSFRFWKILDSSLSICISFPFLCWFFPFVFSCPCRMNVCISVCKTVLQTREEIETLGPFPSNLSFFWIIGDVTMLLGLLCWSNTNSHMVNHSSLPWTLLQEKPKVRRVKIVRHKQAFLFNNMSILNEKLIFVNRPFDVGPTSWVLVFCSLTTSTGAWNSVGHGC